MPKGEVADLRIIETDRDMRAGVAALRKSCPNLKRVHDLVGTPALEQRVAGFEGLAAIVVSQQVSAASADAIWKRTKATIRPFQPRRVLALTESELKSAGLSAPKIRTLIALSTALADRSLALGPLARAPEARIHEALTAVTGIGPWTANIYTMFCLRRADAWASGDLALQLAAGRLLGLKEKPSPIELDEIAERWRPWRGVAARLLWSWHVHPATKASAAGKKTS